jgi:L-threonylcarbamoyladenylate synthase
MARVLRLDDDPSAAVLDDVEWMVAQGAIIALPTETFYALGASVRHAGAVQRVWEIKQRPVGKPILVLIPGRESLGSLAAEMSSAATALMDRFWPGPLTLIVRAVPGLPEPLTAGTGTVGVRQSAWTALTRVLRRVGPMTGTSANRAGAPSPCTAAGVLQALGADVDLVLDGGPTPGGPPSTVVDTTGPVRLVREGAISRAQLEAVLKDVGLTLSGAATGSGFRE